ncbi:hypothetical protein B0O99DRAFT_698931 [Bisporella sp. PMI_857]|nr:hypothetical protein B0O99DRAFT_698931 [Bisporella sp. PMI_857]
MVPRPQPHSRWPQAQHQPSNHESFFKWENQPTGIKCLLVATGIGSALYSLAYGYRYLGGFLIYHYEYVLTASGYAEPLRGCRALKRAEEKLWDQLDNSNWFYLQRCLGNDMGLTRPGEVVPVVWEITRRLANPQYFPGIIPFLGLNLWMLFWGLPWLSGLNERVEDRVNIAIQEMSDQTVATVRFTIYYAVFIAFMFYPRPVAMVVIAFLFLLYFVPKITEIIGDVLRRGPPAFWTKARSFWVLMQQIFKSTTGKIFLGGLPGSFAIYMAFFKNKFYVMSVMTLAWSGLCYALRPYLDLCHHVDDCTCFVECRHGVQCRCYVEHLAAADQYARQLRDYEEVLDQSRREQVRLSPTSPHFHTSQLARENAQVREEYMKFRISAHRNEATSQQTITKLRAELKYAEDSTTDRTQMKEKLDAAVTKYKEDEKLIRKLNSELSQVIHELAAEKNYMRDPCNDSRICDEEKRAMISKIEDLSAELQEHHNQVQEATRVLEYEQLRSHISLTQFLTQTVIEAKKHRHTCQNPTGAIQTRGISPIEDLIRTLQITNDRNFKYVARLEHEVLRLGGDLRTTQSDSPRSIGWYIPTARIYPEAAKILYKVYGDLHTVISQLDGFLQLVGLVVPDWHPAPHDESLAFTDCDGNSCTESLSYKLVETETLHLYWRALQLLSPAEIHVEYLRTTHGENNTDYVARQKTLWPIKRGLQALMAFFEYPQDIQYPTNQRILANVIERRYPIYIGMMNMIRDMHTVVYAWHAKEEISFYGQPPKRRIEDRPLWRVAKSPIYFPTARQGTYGKLVKALIKQELDTLVSRIFELWVYMDKELHMPGTDSGKLIYGDGSNWEDNQSYTAEFRRLKDVWERAGKWIAFWRQKPTPGSDLAAQKIPGVDGWLAPPDAIEDNTSQYGNYKNDNQSQQSQSNGYIPDWFKPKLESDRIDQRDRLKKATENERARIKQLGNLLQAELRKAENARVVWTWPKTGANFLGIRGGGADVEIYRFHMENEALKKHVKELEGKCKQAKIQLPKHPKNVSFNV